VPSFLIARPRWLLWRYEYTDGRWTKVPYQPNRSNGSSTDPKTWSDWESIQIAFQGDTDGDKFFSGIGFALTAELGIVGFDFDHCYNPGTGVINPTVARFLATLNSYTEITPGGDGFRVFTVGALPPDDRKQGDFPEAGMASECYSDGRYLTISGHRFGETTEIVANQAGIDAVHSAIFTERIAKRARAYTNGASSAGASANISDQKLLTLARKAANGIKFTTLYDAGDWNGAGFASRSEADVALCNMLAFWTRRNAESIDRLFRASGLMREKWNREDYRRRTIEAAIESCTETFGGRGHAQDGSGGGGGGANHADADAGFSDNNSESGSRQLITLDPGNLPVSVDSAEKILVANAERLKIYQRAGEVVRIVSLAQKAAAQVKKRDGMKRPDGAIILHPVTTPALLEIFERLIAWQGFNAKGKLVPKNCPARIANAYLSRVGFWELPYLAGVVEAPMLRPDGTVLDVPGYDEATEMFLDAPEGWPAIPASPTRADAEEALRVLREPFKQFPFVGEGSEEVLLAGILTALQRRLLESAPLFGVSAPSQRSGKSLMVESIGIISNGRIPAAAGVSSQSEELRKAITSILREGHLIAHLDNITYPLDSPDLARAITQGIYSDRLLGTNTTLRLPTNVLWTATGNNLTFKGDMSSRALLCRIDAKMEHPEERGFDIADLHTHLRDRRKTLVMAALTILRAFHVAGRPKQILKPWGGFDHWSREIREPLVWLGRADPCRTRETIIVSDPDRDCAMSILSAWREAFGDRAMLVAEIIRDAGSELKALLLMVAASKNDPASIDARRMGAWCRSVEDRVFDEFQLCRFGKSHHAVNWRVSRAGGVDPKPADQNE
jgi:primase-polymerase (primpol)-like protein